MSNGIEDNLIDSFLEDDQLMVKDGKQSINLWQSAKNIFKDNYYQTLFSGGGAMPQIEKVIGAVSAHEFKLLTRYLSGSGEDMPLSDDQSVIDQYLQTVHSKYGHPKDKEWFWKPTTNRELNPNTGIPYADEGWEFMSVDPEYILHKAGIGKPEEGLGETMPSDYMDIYNKLGMNSSVRRRKLDSGDYEYMVVEPWDLIEGEKGKGGADYTQPYESKGLGYLPFKRIVPKTVGLLAKFAPDFVESKSFYQGGKRHKTQVSMNLSPYGKDWLENKAKPFNITGSSIISPDPQQKPYQQQGFH